MLITDCKSQGYLVLRGILLGILLVCCSKQAQALPFNQDLVDMQFRAGSFTRERVAGTVPLGSLARRVASKAEAELLVNPVPGSDTYSVSNGKRLYEINCSACHGWYKPTGFVMAPVAQAGMPAPSLTVDLYKERSDGNLFGTIHFGGMAIMPAYGWKLSIREHWDIVNYIRSIQGVTR